jgi:gamma-glutamylcyclotransferase (GGCT)/AIG2-like uncharacterized protein YtfP
MSDRAGIFIYGSLMRGESRAEIIRRFEPTCWILGQVAGYNLYDLGSFPAAVPAAHRETDGPIVPDWLPEDVLLKQGGLSADSDVMRKMCLQGEFVRVERQEELLQELDRIEGYFPDRPEDSLFRRVLEEVDLHDGRVREAWMYVYNGAPDGTRIFSLDWREHRGIREETLRRIALGHFHGQVSHVKERILERDVWARHHNPQVTMEEAFGSPERLLLDYRFSERKLAQCSGRWTVMTN